MGVPAPALVTVPNVHLASVGTWECMTGTWVCTAEQLASIVAAQADPGIRTPVLKLGHVDPRFDGQPAIGRIQNLRLSDDGLDLYGDYVGVPSWLKDVMGSAYPDRSVEVYFNYVGATGHKHPAILGAVSLLGETPPAISSLEDIVALYGDEPPMAASDGGPTCKSVQLLRKKGAPMGLLDRLKAKMRKAPPVAASMPIEGLYEEFYEALPQGSWAWIREIWTDFLIADDGNGDLYKIPWTEGDDGPEFGDPVRVEVQYVPVTDTESDDAAIDLPSGAGAMLARFSPQASVAAAAGDPVLPDPGGRTLETKDLLARLGLNEDASDDDIEAKLAEMEEAAKVPIPEPAVDTPLELPEGAVLMDAEQHAELVAAAGQGQQAFTRLAQRDRDELLDAAVMAGKIPPARKAHYAALYDQDPDGTREFLDKLEAGLVPVTPGTGHAASTTGDDDLQWAQAVQMSPVLAAAGANLQPGKE